MPREEAASSGGSCGSSSEFVEGVVRFADYSDCEGPCLALGVCPWGGSGGQHDGRWPAKSQRKVQP
jgi:hypothetical protein